MLSPECKYRDGIIFLIAVICMFYAFLAGLFAVGLADQYILFILMILHVHNSIVIHWNSLPSTLFVWCNTVLLIKESTILLKAMLIFKVWLFFPSLVILVILNTSSLGMIKCLPNHCIFYCATNLLIRSLKFERSVAAYLILMNTFGAHKLIFWHLCIFIIALVWIC